MFGRWLFESKKLENVLLWEKKKSNQQCAYISLSAARTGDLLRKKTQ